MENSRSKEVTNGSGTTTARFLYEGGLITLELDGAGNQTAYNVYGGDSIISRKTARGTEYYLYNGRGDVVQLTGPSGAITTEYDYDAFGNMLEEWCYLGYDKNPFRYCCEYWDFETKNYYLRARYYSPATGRFTQRDSYLGNYTDPLSLNRYTYANNNPIRYIDPTGHVVSEYDKKYLTASQQADIQKATDKYNSAPAGSSGDAQRAQAHAEAEAIRAQAASNSYSGGTDGSKYILDTKQQSKNTNTVETKEPVNSSSSANSPSGGGGISGGGGGRSGNSSDNSSSSANSGNSSVIIIPTVPGSGFGGFGGSGSPGNTVSSGGFGGFGGSGSSGGLSIITSNSRANEVAKYFGYDGNKPAEDLKKDYVFNNSANFNIAIDTNTRKVVLVSIQGNIQISTGLTYPASGGGGFSGGGGGRR